MLLQQQIGLFLLFTVLDLHILQSEVAHARTHRRTRHTQGMWIFGCLPIRFWIWFLRSQVDSKSIQNSTIDTVHSVLIITASKQIQFVLRDFQILQLYQLIPVMSTKLLPYYYCPHFSLKVTKTKLYKNNTIFYYLFKSLNSPVSILSSKWNCLNKLRLVESSREGGSHCSVSCPI